MLQNTLSISLFLILAFILEAAPWKIKNYPEERIIGGHNTTIEEHPHQVSLRRNNKTRHLCGGSIISPEWVLSAAHCMRKIDGASSIIVRVGSTNNLYGTDHELSTVLTHPKNYRGAYDFALLQVKRSFRFGRCVQPIKFVRSTPPDNSRLIVTGWGVQGENNLVTRNILQEVHLSIVNQDVCNRLWKGRITPQMFCAAAPNWDKGTCKGDSGGPVLYNGKLAGVVSWGAKGCLAFERPKVFADVTSAFEWIYTVTDRGCSPKKSESVSSNTKRYKEKEYS